MQLLCYMFELVFTAFFIINSLPGTSLGYHCWAHYFSGNGFSLKYLPLYSTQFTINHRVMCVKTTRIQKMVCTLIRGFSFLEHSKMPQRFSISMLHNINICHIYSLSHVSYTQPWGEWREATNNQWRKVYSVSQACDGCPKVS